MLIEFIIRVNILKISIYSNRDNKIGQLEKLKLCRKTKNKSHKLKKKQKKTDLSGFETRDTLAISQEKFRYLIQ